MINDGLFNLILICIIVIIYKIKLMLVIHFHCSYAFRIEYNLIDIFIGAGPHTVPENVKSSQRVFLSNLAYSASEEEVRNFLQDCGPIIAVHLVRDYKGKSKGFAYVSFELEDSAAQALRKDREPLNGRPTYVSKCKAENPSDASQPKPSKNSADQRKLFVKGLPKSKTVDEIKEIFAKYGEVEDIRLLKYPNGQSKGMAYLDYKEAVSGSEALKLANGLDVDGSKISVSINDSPAKSRPENSKGVNLGRNLRRTQKPFIFVPRSLQVKKETEIKDSSSVK